MPELSIKKKNPGIGFGFPNASSSAPILQIMAGGVITGLLQVVLSVSYAALVYGGALSSYLGQGIGFALAGAFVTATIVTLFSSLPGTVGSNQDVSVAIFSIISASIISSMPADTPLQNEWTIYRRGSCDPAAAVYWVPGLVLAVLMFIAGKRGQNTFFLPGLVFEGALAFYAVAWGVGVSTHDRGEQGWLLGPFDDHIYMNGGSKRGPRCPRLMFLLSG